MTGYWEYFDGH